MDFISTLPDHVLGHILSFLPTKTAVATCILSTRWKHVWTFAPNFDIDARLHRYSYVINLYANREYEITFQKFVTRFLLLHHVRNISKFRLIYECHDKSAPVHKWFKSAISHHLQELDLDFCFSVRDNLVDLPRKLFKSSVLSVLKLSRMPLYVPDFVFLPNLKTLELRRIFYYNGSKGIQTLLSGCPILEELVIEETARERPKAVDISIHTLRRFSFSYRFVIDTMVDIPYKFIINTPNLEYFHIKGHISDVFEVKSLASLDTAYIDLRQTALTPESYVLCCQRIIHIFKGIANAQSIAFSGEVVQLLCENLGGDLPIFSNLKQLAFGMGFDLCWKRILINFIKCSTNLEVFTLNNQEGFSRDKEEVMKTPVQDLPDDMIPYLKNILSDELYANFMPEHIEYVMQYVNVLKRLEISCRCPILLRSQIGFHS